MLFELTHGHAYLVFKYQLLFLFQLRYRSETTDYTEAVSVVKPTSKVRKLYFQSSEPICLEAIYDSLLLLPLCQAGNIAFRKFSVNCICGPSKIWQSKIAKPGILAKRRSSSNFEENRFSQNSTRFLIEPDKMKTTYLKLRTFLNELSFFNRRFFRKRSR
jgi:hypothetical protein